MQILRNVSPKISPSFEPSQSSTPIAVFGSLLLEVVVAAPVRRSAAENLAQFAIASFSPCAGQIGSTVVINGSGLGKTTSVSFGGVPASFAVTAAYQITATVPSGTTTGSIVVHSSTAIATSDDEFVVLQTGAARLDHQ